MENLNLFGIALGIATFLIIGICHPIVIKCEYYFGKKCWWCFLVVGLIFAIISMLVSCNYLSALFAVIACSSFWSILEVFHQHRRVERGWFPMNPKRKDEYGKLDTMVK